MERAYRIKADVVDSLRKQRGMSWATLASRADVDAKSLRRWRKGEPALMDNIAALAEALKTSPQRLMEGVEPVEQESEEVALTIPTGGKHAADHLSLLALYLQEAAEKHKADLEYPDWPGIGSVIREQKFQEAIKSDPHYFDDWKKIEVYYIPALDRETKQKKFYYVICAKSRHDEMMEYLDRGEIPYFAVIVGRGYGDPNKYMKDYIKRLYGFDHDFWLSLEGMDETSRQEAIVNDFKEGNDKNHQFEVYANESVDPATVARVLGDAMAEEYCQWLATNKKHKHSTG